MSSGILRVLMLLAATSACAGKSPASGSGEGQAPIGRNRDVISADELSADPGLRSQSVLEVVRALRPHFLSQRGTASGAERGKVHASIDNGRIVSLAELGMMHGNSVVEIRYLSAAQAMQKFGGAALEGPVIVVRTQ